MPRVIGIDPGTITIDICGLDNGRLFLDESISTVEALRDPGAFVRRLKAIGSIDLVAGPSGYGLPCVAGDQLTDTDLRLAVLAADEEPGGIGGLRALMRALAHSDLPVVFTPGVIHLTSVPPHRKVNRIDMGTADKVCAAALAIRDQARRRHCALEATAFVLLELGGAFTAAIAVSGGRIVDGAGGSSGSLGFRAAGALDGEVAFLAGHISKSTLFIGGVVSISGDANAEALFTSTAPQHRLAREAYVEGAAKSVTALLVSAPDAREVILSGRLALVPAVRDDLARRLGSARADLPIAVLAGSTASALQAAEGAALLADGLAGGSQQPLVDLLGIRHSRGTVLDYLHVISREQALKTLGIGQ